MSFIPQWYNFLSKHWSDALSNVLWKSKNIKSINIKTTIQCYIGCIFCTNWVTVSHMSDFPEAILLIIKDLMSHMGYYWCHQNMAFATQQPGWVKCYFCEDVDLRQTRSLTKFALILLSIGVRLCFVSLLHFGQHNILSLASCCEPYITAT